MKVEDTPTVTEMLRTTGDNTQKFMLQIALHVEKLEQEIARLRETVTNLGGDPDADTQSK